MKASVTLLRNEYKNQEGETKVFLEVSGKEDFPNTRLLCKKKDGVRRSADEMIAFIKSDAPNWRDKLEYVVNATYGNYFVLNLLEIDQTTVDI
jgi:hypothetical protein